MSSYYCIVFTVALYQDISLITTHLLLMAVFLVEQLCLLGGEGETVRDRHLLVDHKVEYLASTTTADATRNILVVKGNKCCGLERMKIG